MYCDILALILPPFIWVAVEVKTWISNYTPKMLCMLFVIYPCYNGHFALAELIYQKGT